MSEKGSRHLHTINKAETLKQYFDALIEEEQEKFIDLILPDIERVKG